MESSLATFNPALATERDKMRIEIGDTEMSRAIFQDATIDSMLTAYSFKDAAIRLCESAALKFAQMPDEVSEAGEVTYSYKERAATFMAKAAVLRKTDEPPPAQNYAPMETGALMGQPPVNWCGFKPY